MLKPKLLKKLFEHVNQALDILSISDNDLCLMDYIIDAIDCGFDVSEYGYEEYKNKYVFIKMRKKELAKKEEELRKEFGIND